MTELFIGPVMLDSVHICRWPVSRVALSKVTASTLKKLLYLFPPALQSIGWCPPTLRADFLSGFFKVHLDLHTILLWKNPHKAKPK